MQLEEIIKQIQPLDKAAMQSALARQNMLTKPQGSLGRLEELSIQLAGMMANPLPSVERKAVIVMAGDHGVALDGVSAYPPEVTSQMVLNFLHGGAAINVLARQAGARVVVVDMGVASEIEDASGKLLRRRVGPGTANLAKGPAMTRAQAEESIQSGIEIAEAEIAQGVDILATGDMGIGNTTPSAAIAACILGHAPSEIVGRGTGVDESGLVRKIHAVVSGLKVNKPNPADGLDVLAKVGGFEIGALAGLIIGAAANRKPVIVDGFIATAGAMIAYSLEPFVRDYLICAHQSVEPGHGALLAKLQCRPLLDLNLRLGEGTGAALAMNLVDAAVAILTEVATFAEAGVSSAG